MVTDREEQIKSAQTKLLKRPGENKIIAPLLIIWDLGRLKIKSFFKVDSNKLIPPQILKRYLSENQSPSRSLIRKGIGFITSKLTEPKECQFLSSENYLEENFRNVKAALRLDLIYFPKRYRTASKIKNFILQNSKKITLLPLEQIKTYLNVINRIDDSPSREIKQFKDSIFTQLLNSSQPVEDYQKIESIFLSQDLPLVDKIYKVFIAFYSPERLRLMINRPSSLFLPSVSGEENYGEIYQDLLKIHLQSGNYSMKEYAESLKNSGQTVPEIILQMYLRPVGLNSLTDLLEKMKVAKISTDKRNRQIIEESREKAHRGEAFLSLRVGDFLKNVNIEQVPDILSNGVIAKEFLGGHLDPNTPPLTVEISRVVSDDTKNGVDAMTNYFLSKDFGEVLLGLKNRGQYQISDPRQSDPNLVASDKVVLLKIESRGDGRYGIRTGFPSTEISFIIVKKELISSRPDVLEQLFLAIAQNNYYLPVTNESGKVIFTPERYNEYRAVFAGLKKFDGPELVFRETTAEEKSSRQLLKIAAEIYENRERVNRVTDLISREVRRVLNNLGMNLQSDTNSNYSGVEFLDIGSTNRLTNVPENFDIDLRLKLDSKNFSRVTELVQSLENTLIFRRKFFFRESSIFYQLRLKSITSVGGEKLEKPLDLDLGLSNKFYYEYSTHEAMFDKLNYIKDHHGELAYRETLANIILTKQILSKGGAYKTGKQGGFGGAGIENWILSNGGNMEYAFRNFQQAAYENGQRLSYEKFREKYRIFSAGWSDKLYHHENFIRILQSNGYEAMLNIIEEYFSSDN